MGKQLAKIDAIQGVRAVAFLAIFVSHTPLGTLGCLGAWGVSVFFVMSGFLMMLSALNKDSAPRFSFGFAWNKIRALYPLHILMMLLAAVYAMYQGRHIIKTVLDIGIHTLLVQMWIPKSQFYTTLNGPAWYLCTSFFLYLCFPLIFKFCKKHATVKRACLGLGLSMLLYILIGIACYLWAPQNPDAWFTSQWITYYFPPVRLIDFVAGCLLGYLFFAQKSRPFFDGGKLKAWSVIAEIVVGVLILASWIVYRESYGILGTQAFKFSQLFLPTTLALIWLVANQNGIFSRILSLKPFVELGNLSPYTFLIHGVAIKYCTVVLDYVHLANALTISVAALVLTLVAAFLWKPIWNHIRQ